ncbi:DUF4337 domain-containing protein [Geothrix sp. PMB-07]|uniref:DUF4337 domain-containing protein n=1 Tax=Geothrix sp. PMB-07 TaxID=3068640 RepID=UPI0027421591|nr:DUF4337 domain-containing protein [Geothrix sp. PMB-07]WLT32303.1 DUF4337 domain-containing protein [Geothrix sp. PMB-07]
MAEEKKEPWLNLLALTTVILAVCATLATFKGGGYSTKTVLSQAQASDEWAHYQAKGIKGNLYEVEAMRLKREIELAPKASKEVLEKSLADVEKKVAKYEGEKAEIDKTARGYEAAKAEAQKHGAPFGLAVIFLQIAILLSSIAALMKKQPVYWAGLVVGVVGLVYFANGFFLFFRV